MGTAMETAMRTAIVDKHGNGVDVGTARDDTLRRLEEVCGEGGMRFIKCEACLSRNVAYIKELNTIIVSPLCTSEQARAFITLIEGSGSSRIIPA